MSTHLATILKVLDPSTSYRRVLCFDKPSDFQKEVKQGLILLGGFVPIKMHLGLLQEKKLYLFHDLKTYSLFLEIRRVYEAWVGRIYMLHKILILALKSQMAANFLLPVLMNFALGLDKAFENGY